MQNFGETIKAFRKSADLTQTQFAEKLGVHLQTISKWERGLLVPDFALLGEIAAVLSVSLEALLGLPEGEQAFTGVFDAGAFGKALCEARKLKNESQSELAAAVGATTDNISKWERGVTCPDLPAFVSLAVHFEIPASKLYFGICKDTEIELPAQWRRRKKLHLLWLGCAVVPLLTVIAVLAALLLTLPEREVSRTEFYIDYWLCGGNFRTEVPYLIREEDGEVTLAIPQKAGSEFLGWYLSPDYSGGSVASVSCCGEDISVYAKWSDLSFDVRYELGGGILSDNNPALVTAQDSFPLNEPVRKGYLFLGWFDSPDGGTRYERVGGADAKNLTLYAAWQKCDVKFSVTYELGGGTLKKDNPAWLEAGEICTLNEPAKRGHDFVGWNRNADGSGEYLTRLYGISEDLVLYAVYSPKAYTVRYVYEGAYENEPNPNRIVFGETVPLSPVFLYGNEFLGWFTEKAGGTKIEEIGENNLPELSVLYAQFRPLEFSVFLDAGEGNFEMNGESVSRYTVNVKYGTPQPLPVPSRDGYIFLGWADEKGNYAEEIDIYNLNDITLTAMWRPVELRYRIRYELDGGIQNDENPTEAVSGQRVELFDPQKTGYRFLGWFDDAEGRGKRYDHISEENDHDIVLYAVWQEIKIIGSADNFTYERIANTVKITGYTGPAGDNIDLVFPTVVDGIPVTEITEKDPRHFPAVFHSITIPDTVTVLGASVFQYATAAEPLIIPSRVQRIEQLCFYEYGGKVCFPEHGELTYIGYSAFYGVVFGETLVLPEGITTVDANAFGCIDADGVILPDSIRSIGDTAFQNVEVGSSRKNVFLPSSVTYIAQNAFAGTNVYTALTAEQTEKFDPNWAKMAVKLAAEKHKLTLSDGGDTETFEDLVFVLPARKKAGYTFLGWKNAQDEFVPNCYIPRADETLCAAYEENSPTDGRAKNRAIPLEADRAYEICYVSMRYVYFIWQGETCRLQFNMTGKLSTYLLRDGEQTSFYGTCDCKKGDLICIGGDWATAGTKLSFTALIV